MLADPWTCYWLHPAIACHVRFMVTSFDRTLAYFPTTSSKPSIVDGHPRSYFYIIYWSLMYFYLLADPWSCSWLHPSIGFHVPFMVTSFMLTSFMLTSFNRTFTYFLQRQLNKHRGRPYIL